MTETKLESDSVTLDVEHPRWFIRSPVFGLRSIKTGPQENVDKQLVDLL